MALVARRADHEEVRVADQVAHVERDQVVRLLRIGDRRDPLRQRRRLQPAQLALPGAALTLGRAPARRSRATTASGTRWRMGRPPATRRLMAVDEIPISGIFTISARSPPPRRSTAASASSAAVPAREAIPSRASSSTRRGSRHPSSPRGNVGPQQEDEVVRGPCVGQQLKRTEGERRPLSGGLDVRGLQQPVRVRGQPRHLEPHLRARLRIDPLVGRLTDGHQQHPLEAQLERRLLREHQVPDVRRVERAPENADRGDPNPYSRTWPWPWTTYLKVVSSRRPIGPRAWSFCVELPISAPMPNSKPSVKRVDALT